MFEKWFKKPEKREEDNTFIGLRARITRLEADILDLYTAQDAIRDKVLRKIQQKRQEKTEETTQQEENIHPFPNIFPKS